MRPPCTPQELGSPALPPTIADALPGVAWKEKGRLTGHSRQKVGRHARRNPWIHRSSARKSLNVHNKFLTGSPRFSTCRRRASTPCSFSSTCSPPRSTPSLSIYLYIFKREEREKEALKRKTSIHGLGREAEKPSTGCTSLPRVFRGLAWMHFIQRIMELSA